jgi:hypothetical protein
VRGVTLLCGEQGLGLRNSVEGGTAGINFSVQMYKFSHTSTPEFFLLQFCSLTSSAFFEWCPTKSARSCCLVRLLNFHLPLVFQRLNQDGLPVKSPHSHPSCIHSPTSSYPQRPTSSCLNHSPASIFRARFQPCHPSSQPLFSCRIGRSSRFFLFRRKRPAPRVPTISGQSHSDLLNTYRAFESKSSSAYCARLWHRQP